MFPGNRQVEDPISISAVDLHSDLPGPARHFAAGLLRPDEVTKGGLCAASRDVHEGRLHMRVVDVSASGDWRVWPAGLRRQAVVVQTGEDLFRGGWAGMLDGWCISLAHGQRCSYESCDEECSGEGNEKDGDQMAGQDLSFAPVLGTPPERRDDRRALR
jgi:hypothetical protein